MTKQAKLGIVVLVGLAVAAASYYFLIWKPAHPKAPKTPDDASLPPSYNPGSTSPSKNTGLNTPPPTNIGKVAYAKQNGVPVLNADGSLYKTAASGEWIGTILGQETKGGRPFYRVSGNRYVSTGYVSLK